MRWLTGHKKDVRAVAFTPDGRVVSGGSDNTVRVWDAGSGECVATVKAKAPVYAVAASPDGKTLATAGRNAPRAESNFVFFHDPAGKPLGKFEWRTFGTVFNGDFRSPVYGTSRIAPVARSIWSLSYSADGRFLAAACRQPGAANIPSGADGRVWELASPGEGHPLAGFVYAVAFAPEGTRLASTREKAVHFLPTPDTTEVVVYQIPANWSPAVAFAPGRDLVVIASGGFLFFVNPTRHEKPVKVKTGIRTVTALAASPDGRTVLAGGKPGTVEVYDAGSRTKTTTYDFEVGGVHAVAFAADGLTFAVGGDKGLVVCDAPG